jgi:hypothetical protein
MTETTPPPEDEQPDEQPNLDDERSVTERAAEYRDTGDTDTDDDDDDDEDDDQPT